MRTRTLLLLAVCCGLAILLAGGIQLLRLAGDDVPAQHDLAVGSSSSAGDATATVLAVGGHDGQLVVTLRLEGVDDPDGIAAFVLLAGAEVPASAPTEAGDCRGITVEPVTCDLRFDTSDVPDGPRVLRWRRGEDQRRWSLA